MTQCTCHFHHFIVLYESLPSHWITGWHLLKTIVNNDFNESFANTHLPLLIATTIALNLNQICQICSGLCAAAEEKPQQLGCGVHNGKVAQTLWRVFFQIRIDWKSQFVIRVYQLL